MQDFHFNLFYEDFDMTNVSKFVAAFLSLRQSFMLRTNYLARFLFLFSVIAVCNNMVSAQSVLTTINIGPEAGNGLRPSAVAVNQRSNKVYVVNESTGNISVIDGSSNLVEATIDLEKDEPVYTDISFIEVNPATNMIYSASTISSIEEVDNGDIITTKATPRTVITVIDGITNNIAAIPVI